jgi:TetR/AcrR family fatty acid metabolism transcriptional regulator
LATLRRNGRTRARPERAEKVDRIAPVRYVNDRLVIHLRRPQLTPRIVDKDERRAHILEAATHVFARQGYQAARIEDVAREAGIAKGTVYLYFGSRDEILVAAFEAFAEEMMAGVRAVLESEAPALSRLRSVVRVVLSSMEAEPELSRVVLDFWSAGTFGAMGSGEKPSIDFGTVYAQYRGLFDTLLEEAKREGSVRGDLPNDAPAVIVGAIEGVMLQWIVDSEAPSPLKMVEPMLEVLLDGLSKGGAGR